MHVQPFIAFLSGSKILNLCDKLRDDHLIELGVRLEDVEGMSKAVPF